MWLAFRSRTWFGIPSITVLWKTQASCVWVMCNLWNKSGCGGWKSPCQILPLHPLGEGTRSLHLRSLHHMKSAVAISSISARVPSVSCMALCRMTVRSQLLTLMMRVAIGLRASINWIAVLVEGYTLIRDVGVYTIPDTSIPELLQGHP